VTGELRIVSVDHVRGLGGVVLVDAGNAAPHVKDGVVVSQGRRSWQVRAVTRDRGSQVLGLYLHGDDTPMEGSLWL
jgi:hypothetical protein